jgi:NADH dehydrogenase
VNISIIGGTGFVGSYIVDRLIECGHSVRLMSRSATATLAPSRKALEVVVGDVESDDDLHSCIRDTDAVIYLIGILREFPDRGVTFEALQERSVERTIQVASDHGVQRFLLMSANGVRPDGTAYQQTKYRAEEALKATDLQWTIFRPSVIFGDPRGRMEFCTQLRRDIIDSPLPAPLFYDGLLPTHAGAFELSPVAVEDVAEAFVSALERPETIGETLQLCGPDRLTWRHILKTIGSAVGKSKIMLPAPAFVVKTVAAVLDKQAWFPITRDQIEMLLEGNVCDTPGAFALLDIVPKRFDVDALTYLRSS